jgi:hypothetical protein
MTLDKHTLQGVPKITSKTLSKADFEQLLVNAGYTQVGSAPAKGDRVKVWWSHMRSHFSIQPSVNIPALKFTASGSIFNHCKPSRGSGIPAPAKTGIIYSLSSSTTLPS